MLVAGRLYGPAFALMRVLLESYIRGVWIHKCADENGIEKFTKEKIPRFQILLEDIEGLEAYENKVLSRLKDRAWQSMNSYTHTGYLHILRRRTETTIEANYDDDEIFEVVDFANSIGYLAAIAMCDLGNNVELANTILTRFKSE